MPRITVNVDDEAESWLEEEADRLGISKAEAGGRCIELMQSDSGYITVNQDDSPDVVDRLDELEQRVDELEASTDTDEGIGAAAPEPQREPVDDRREHRDDRADVDVDSADQEASDSLRDEMEARLEEVDVPGRDPAVERVRREAVAYAWRRLREEGEMRPRDLANDTFGRYFDEPDLAYKTASGRFAGYQLWDNCVRTALRELPGVHTGRTWRFHEPD